MSMSDPIADMLTRIRNAGKAKIESLDIPASKIKVELARILKDEGFIKNYKSLEDDKQGVLRIYMKYDDSTCAVFGLKRVSKPSRRLFMKSKDIKPVLSGMGISVVSTSKGVMTDRQARQENVGGEILCTIW